MSNTLKIRTLRNFHFLATGLIAISIWIFLANLWNNHSFFIDDAFIEFRYASNLINGNGLVWNPGEAPCEGYSNFLSILIFAPFLFFKFNPVVVSKIVGVVSVLLTAYLLYKICGWGGISRPISLLISCIYITLPPMVAHSLSGLQTTLFSAVLFFLFFCAVRARTENNYVWCLVLPVAYTAAVLVRPEGVFFSSLFLFFACFYVGGGIPRLKKPFVISCVICFLAGGLYLLWKLNYFGTILSSPFLVKVNNSWCLPGKFELILFILRNSTLFLFAFLGFIISYRKSVLVRYAAFFIPLLLITYLFNWHLMGFESRFFMPAVPFILILSATVFELLFSMIPGNCLRILFLISCVILINPSNINPLGTSFVETRKLFFCSKEAPRESWTDVDIRIGKRLGNLKGASKLDIASEDSGAIGYYSGSKVIDLVGLTNPYIATSKNSKEFCDRVFSYNPDMIILRSARYQKPADEGGISTYPQLGAFGALDRFGQSAITDDERFKDRYVFTGSMLDADEKISGYRWNFWVRKDSPLNSVNDPAGAKNMRAL